MARNRRGRRDGTGPRAGSWQRRTAGVGRRQQAGEECPWDYKTGKFRRR